MDSTLKKEVYAVVWLPCWWRQAGKAACLPILFGFAEARKENPRGVIGFFDISKRSIVDREILTFTVPFRLYQGMEDGVEDSFLELDVWRKLQERQ